MAASCHRKQPWRLHISGRSRREQSARSICRIHSRTESPAAATPASAHASSLSDVSPVTPTAPINWPSASTMSMPPAAGTTPCGQIGPSDAMNVGRSDAISAILRLDTPSASDPPALAIAIWGRSVEAPSSRCSATRCPPGSSTATQSGLKPSSTLRCSVAVIILLASSSVMRTMHGSFVSTAIRHDG